MADDVITRDENGDLAVRTVSATESATASQYDDLYARTSDGKRALRVVGGGGSGGLPDQAGHSGFLQTDGESASWSDKEPLVNAKSMVGSIVIGDGATLGGTLGSAAVIIGANAMGNQRGVGSQVVIGYNAAANPLGYSSIAIGYKATTIGSYGSIAIGPNAQALGEDAIQLGRGNNSGSKTCQIWDYNILDKTTGLIPSERLAADGTPGQVLSKTDTGMQWKDMTGGTGTIEPQKITFRGFGQKITFIPVDGLTALSITCSILNELTIGPSIQIGDGYIRNGSTLADNNIIVPRTGGTMVVATPPTTAGTYVLKATVADDGTMTTEWVAE